MCWRHPLDLPMPFPPSPMHVLLPLHLNPVNLFKTKFCFHAVYYFCCFSHVAAHLYALPTFYLLHATQHSTAQQPSMHTAHDPAASLPNALSNLFTVISHLLYYSIKPLSVIIIFILSITV